MKIGFCIEWNKGSLDLSKPGNVIGEELMVQGFAKYMEQEAGVTSVEMFAPNYQPTEKLDVMIYMNNTKPNHSWAHKHVLYFQNAYPDEGGDKALQRYYTYGYDGYMIYSHKLLDLHRQSGRDGIFMPYGVDFDIYKPVPYDSNYAFDCAYVGNNIKGRKRTSLYIYPAKDFHFGLYGNWVFRPLSTSRRIRQALGLRDFPFGSSSMKELDSISQGKMAPQDAPKLYCSSKIILNCTLQDTADWDVTTLRIFEVMACKGFLISDRTPRGEVLMKDCMVFTDGGQDLKDKIRYYISHPEERQRIAENGYNYVRKYGSVQLRAQEMLSYIKTI